jgi:hypothetical protein
VATADWANQQDQKSNGHGENHVVQRVGLLDRWATEGCATGNDGNEKDCNTDELGDHLLGEWSKFQGCTFQHFST